MKVRLIGILSDWLWIRGTGVVVVLVKVGVFRVEYFVCFYDDFFCF